ncbi:MAG: PKD domain-containing protein, partial [Chloroflexota bacterium]
MKKLLFPIVVVLILAIGCLPAPVSNQPPAAYIDLVSPANATLGETVTFTGHGADPDGSITSYHWQSSMDGDLSTSASFETSSLSQGTHSIWFKVQDDKGEWSKQVLTTVIVVPTGGGRPVVNSFNANPGEIAPGGSSTLSWDVSGAE